MAVVCNHNKKQRDLPLAMLAPTPGLMDWLLLVICLKGQCAYHAILYSLLYSRFLNK